MKDIFDEYHDCTIINEEVNVTGFWSTHETSTTPMPKTDLIYLTEFNCDHMSTCGRNGNCPVRKAMQVAKNT